MDHVANTARPADIRVALSASYGLGGHNAVLALTRDDEDAMSWIRRLSPRAEKTIRLVVTCAVAAVLGITAVVIDSEPLAYVASGIVLAGHPRRPARRPPARSPRDGSRHPGDGGR